MRITVSFLSVAAGVGAAVLTPTTPWLARMPTHSGRSNLRCVRAQVARAQVDSLTLERQSEVLEVLSAADDMALVDHLDPTLSADIVSLGLVRRVDVDTDSSTVSIALELPTEAAAAGAGDRLTARCTELLQAELPWVKNVRMELVRQEAAAKPTDVSALQQLASSMRRQPASAAANGATSAAEVAPGVEAVSHIVAVASCKGGVGKSTTAVNLAYALAARGLRVGLVDLDVYGPSLPTMVKPDAPLQLDGEALLPLQAHGVKLMSMGYINPGVMPLRGAKVTPIVQQLVGRTRWGVLDFLIVDLPPGTGDVQLTLSQDFRVAAAVLVTTPQRLSFVDVVKGVEMFDKVGIPTVAVMENMAEMRLDHLAGQAEALIRKHSLSDAAADELRALLSAPQPVFGESHVPQLRQMWGIDASYSIPLLPEIASSADGGVPLVVSTPDGPAAALYAQLAAAVETEVTGLEGKRLPAMFFSTEEQMVVIAVPDGSTQRIAPHDLRRRCRSPSNRPDQLPAKLAPLDFVPMGNYAVSVMWSDGHQSLLPYSSFVDGL